MLIDDEILMLLQQYGWPDLRDSRRTLVSRVYADFERF
jgi:hypothetical protein